MNNQSRFQTTNKNLFLTRNDSEMDFMTAGLQKRSQKQNKMGNFKRFKFGKNRKSEVIQWQYSSRTIQFLWSLYGKIRQ